MTTEFVQRQQSMPTRHLPNTNSNVYSQSPKRDEEVNNLHSQKNLNHQSSENQNQLSQSESTSLEEECQ